MLIFNTKNKYEIAEKKICSEMGYPDGVTERWSDERTAIINNANVWLMPKHDTVDVDFDDEQVYNPEWEAYKRVED